MLQTRERQLSRKIKVNYMNRVQTKLVNEPARSNCLNFNEKWLNKRYFLQMILADNYKQRL